jgi:hypothetical protein
LGSACAVPRAGDLGGGIGGGPEVPPIGNVTLFALARGRGMDCGGGIVGVGVFGDVGGNLGAARGGL